MVGPTASGKSALAVRLAGEYGGEVVSADSMQIYKGMPLAAAVPTPGERGGVPHHLLEVLEPTRRCSVALYCSLADEVIGKIAARGSLPVLCGGTGLYIDSLLRGTVFFDEGDLSAKENFAGNEGPAGWEGSAGNETPAARGGLVGNEDLSGEEDPAARDDPAGNEDPAARGELVGNEDLSGEEDPAAREQLLSEAETLSDGELYRRLRDVDPVGAGAVHPRDRKRVLRSLLSYYATGMRKPERDALSRGEPPYEACCIGLYFPEREELYRRINARADGMLERGLLREAEHFYRRRSECPTAGAAIGHKEFYPYFEGAVPLSAAVEDFKRATRRYAKRQLTWFRANPGIHWVRADGPDGGWSEARAIADKFLSEGGGV